MVLRESNNTFQSWGTVLTERHDGVAIVTLNNPDRKNALSPELSDELVDAFADVDADHSIGALVIKGAEGTFCSGADLRTLDSAMDDPAGETAYSTLDRIYRAFTRLGELNVPTIAAIRGSAVGAGVNLAMAADVRVVAKNARIMSGFFRIGVHPGGGHFQLLVQATNRETATAMSIFSQEISGAKAVELGLAWDSVDDTEVEDRALSLALLAGADPELSRKSILTLRHTTPPAVPWATALQSERAPQLWSFRRAAIHRDRH